MSNVDWVKDPNSTLDFSFDWSKWVENNDYVKSFEIFIYPSIPHHGQLSISNTKLHENLVTVWLSQGRINVKYLITCRITTMDNRVEDSTRVVRIDPE